MRSRLFGNAAQERCIAHMMLEVEHKILHAGHSKRQKRVAQATARTKCRAFERYVRVLIVKLGYRMKSVKALGEKHYRAYAAWCLQQSLSAGSLANVHTWIKDVYERVLEKPNCIGPTVAYYGDATRRSHICETSKAWEDCDLRDSDGRVVTAEQLRESLREFSEETYLLLQLCHLLGLRMREAIFFRPLIDVRGSFVVVREEGSKNGRRREVNLDLLTATDRAKLDAVLLRCAELVVDIDGTLMNPRGLSIRWTHARRQVGTVLEKVGITKAGFGVTTHGLRHGFLQRMQEHLSGAPVPLHGALPAPAVRDEKSCAINAVARLITSEAAGHSRAGVTASYYGSAYRQYRESGGSRPEWSTALKWVRDIERGDVERLEKRLLELRADGVDLAELRSKITERARLARPSRPYG